MKRKCMIFESCQMEFWLAIFGWNNPCAKAPAKGDITKEKREYLLHHVELLREYWLLF